MTAPPAEAGPLKLAARALRLAISHEPEAWHETADFHAGARAAIAAYVRARSHQPCSDTMYTHLRFLAAELDPAPAERIGELEDD